MSRNIHSHAEKKQKRISSHLEKINLFAAGVDIGSETHFVAVPEELDDRPVRSFSCFTADLEAMADWLVETNITTVVMESTGVYWIPVFEILESRGFDVKLVNARHVTLPDVNPMLLIASGCFSCILTGCSKARFVRKIRFAHCVLIAVIGICSLAVGHPIFSTCKKRCGR